MENEIVLLKNNADREWSDLEWVNEFYNFLQGEMPDSINDGKPLVKLSSRNAFHIIWYLQEHFSVFSDHIEQCTECKDLFDSDSAGYYSEITGKHFCDACYPPGLDEKEGKILKRRAKKQSLTNNI